MGFTIQKFEEQLGRPALNDALKSVMLPGMDLERVKSVMKSAVLREPKLLNCDLASIFDSCKRAVELGLVPGSQDREAYLVPYGQRCELIIGYKGHLKLMYRSEQFASIDTQVVWPTDEFSLEFPGPKLRHKINPDDPRRQYRGVYSRVVLVSGQESVEYMSREQVDHVRKTSRARSDAWTNYEDEMSRKTVLNRHQKRLPKSDAMKAALDHYYRTEGLIDIKPREVVVRPSRPHDTLAARLGVEPEPEPEPEPGHEPFALDAPVQSQDFVASDDEDLMASEGGREG